MSKFLSIIVPHYKESERTVFPLLSSIANQLGVDFADIEVIISNDGGARALDADFLGLFSPLEIAQVDMETNGGPGLARQAGIDVASGQYLMFCDADDILHNVGVLGAMMQEAEKSACDILSTSWLEEIDSDGVKRYITHAHEMTWMHGKLIRRQFLTQNGIRHHPDLRVHEDSYILSIASSLTDRMDYLDITSYVWKYGADSITRRNGAIYTYDSVPTFIFACTEAAKEVEKKAPQVMEYKMVQLVMYCYFSLHLPGWQDQKEHLKASEDAFAKYMPPLWRYVAAANPQMIAQVYNEERAKTFAGCVESETLPAWLKRLGLGD